MIAQVAAVILGLTALAFPRCLLPWGTGRRELAVAATLAAGAMLVNNFGVGLLVFGAVLLGASEARR